jgi:hypothetical protein
MGETPALSLSKGMRSPALRRGVNEPLKKPAREPRNERKGSVIPLEKIETAEMIEWLNLGISDIHSFSLE